ncbi:hypothetical protein AB0F15_38895 [Amycolatopsis sp. NPDC026612]|uniref:hypothetical protein n=1 Tax=Amycolatopsis sp. NPDC026612 TaxID=3155466 RepID=UPI0033C59DBE
MAMIAACAVTACAFDAAPAVADTDDDSQLVYCLAPDSRDALIDAAVALGLAQRSGNRLVVGGEILDVQAWRGVRPEDFRRTCEALSAAERAPGPSALASALPFLTGVTSALLAFAAALALASVTRGRERAAHLRSASDDFRQAVEAYLDGWDKTHLRVEATGRRSALLSRLGVVRTAHRRWVTVEAVEHELVGGAVGQAISQPSADGRDLTADLKAVHDDVLRIARALEQPLWPHPGMHSLSGRSA